MSSGFLAFARHLGFLRAIEEAHIRVDAVCGTSSGALVGALWLAGYDIDTLIEELSEMPPIRLFSWSWAPWRGVFTLQRVVTRLQGLLPATFAELERPLAVGVTGPGGEHELITAGSLPEAVAASCAIPRVFQPVWVDGRWLSDGGAVDRCGVAAWRRWRVDYDAIVHWVEATHGEDPDPHVFEGLTVVRTPASGATFFSLGNFRQQVEQARLETQSKLKNGTVDSKNVPA